MLGLRHETLDGTPLPGHLRANVRSDIGYPVTCSERLEDHRRRVRERIESIAANS